MALTPFRHGIALFNRGQFFDAHEVLEDVWRPSRGRRRPFLQALIQVAVGLHHHSRGNLLGARSLLARAGNTLAPYPSVYAGLKVAPLRASLDTWRAALAEGRPAPPLPKLEFAKPVLESGLR
jgi:predicted metal-dependent hydrolase